MTGRGVIETTGQTYSAAAWQVLGWARYRDGQWRASIDALDRSIELQGDVGNPYQWFWLGMAHWQVGEKDQARDWYNKAMEWLKQGAPPRQAEQFRREAAALLNVETRDDGL